ncbi:thioesterase family protein [Pseudogulbenkiania subflava]|uniref:4-hydroxybenzoyl-CoA thioesterase n=1 Tax=Pseudogulbenkiania subflava DSM 22618 TaxID=1123014 RepID=A0A1Y6BJK5_9NEIS|nr:thioesterase family protein [Pseudogulbenkiania subflava]SMF11184.1 4-hydroxybenzoyl-CoA thioesterase [Pseudogulbenkiania subflava DSM 22618]
MARIQIPLPETFVFEITLDIRIGDINYGGHLANDAMLRLAHEARLRFFKAYGYTELDVEGHGIIMTDAAIVYKAEVFHGESLIFRLGLADPNKYGFDLVYQASHDKTGQEVARLKTGIVFFDYGKRKIAPMPDVFMTRFPREQQGGMA